MRLWHYEILDYLPKAQLVSQWRECVCIAKSIHDNGTPNHILVNRIMDYSIEEFNIYCNLVVRAMLKRGYNVSSQSIEKLEEYIDFRGEPIDKNRRIFKDWHDEKYMMVCYYNFKSYHEWRCRGCHCILKSASKHCPTCGQAIDWMEVYKNAGEKNDETVGN